MNTALLLRTIDVWMTYRLRPFYLRAKCQGTFFFLMEKPFFPPYVMNGSNLLKVRSKDVC